MDLHARLDRRFEAVVFDWDGTAVPDRAADAAPVRRLIEELCAQGLDVAVVSGTHVGNIDGQLAARPSGPGRLHLCLNRGSEVFQADAAGVRLLERRTATPAENAALDRAADLAVAVFAERGLRVEIVSSRLNRRKLDLIPEPVWRDPPKARIAELVAAVEGRLRAARISGLTEAVALARRTAVEAGLEDPRVTSDAKHVEIGLTDKSDSARWLLRDLWRRGIGPSLVLIVGDELGPLGGAPGSDSLLLVPETLRSTAASVGVEPGGVPDGVVLLRGGPNAFLALLADQLVRRTERAVPDVDRDPAWSIVVERIDPELERAHEAILTLEGGGIGTSGSPIGRQPAAMPRVLAAGVFAGRGSASELLSAPAWNVLPFELPAGGRLTRILDLRTGLLRQELTASGSSVVAVMFASLARTGTAALRAEGPAELLRAGEPFTPVPARGEASPFIGGRDVLVTEDGAGVAAAASETCVELGRGRRRLERLAAYQASPYRSPSPAQARESLLAAESAGFERLLVEQREAWARRFDDADVTIAGDPELQRAVRFALFHLIGSTGVQGETALGARGTSGPGYRGHVFWDADVFVLPFLAATHRPAARTLLEYRLRRLGAARQAAARRGYAGARFAWESARSGQDVTPASAVDRSGQVVPILTGEHEEHIVADVAWAAAHYIDWSGDDGFARGPGRLLLVETARYWASRIRLDLEGRAHIDDVIGPDEYHERVTDNAFTNVMARWNLRRAAQAAAHGPDGVEGSEIERWELLAEALVDGLDRQSGLYEQFAGFHELEPLVIGDIAERPVAAEALLGRERVQGAQVLKQADVLMLHHLVPEEVAPGSLEANLSFYEPRTAHGSSLSPGVHASLLARAGRLREAVEQLRLAARIDLDDLTGTTAAGLHLAAMGSVWQALAWGFAGLRPVGAALAVDPRLPSGWDALELRVRFRDVRVRVRVEPDRLELEADRELEVLLGAGRSPGRAGPGGLTVLGT